MIFEIRSPSDRWEAILTKVGEYIKAGVLVVGVLDPESLRAFLFYPGDQNPRILEAGDELTLPEVLREFRVPVRRFFE